MSSYYNQEFVSPEPLFAEVKEELSSYFMSGAIDDIMFPRWTENCLERFRKSALKIKETVLHVRDYKACLPDDYKGVREAWMCSTYHSDLYQSAVAQYYQSDCRLDPVTNAGCAPCTAGANSCTTDYNVVHKVTGSYFWSFKRTFLLTPGNQRARTHCGDHCPNIGASSPHTFDIDNGHIILNSPEGTIHLIYYAEAVDENGEQLVPDNFWLKDYIKKHLIFKCFSKLSNIIVDETFNQIVHKKQEAREEQDVALITAQIEMKKETVTDKVRAIKRTYNQLNRYRMPGDPSDNNAR